MKIAVLGSNSFSGSHFVDHALASGYSVLGISRSPEVSTAFRPYAKNPQLQSFRFLQASLRFDMEKVNQALKDLAPEYVVNFAAQSMVGESWANPGDWFMTNAVSTVKFHDELRKCDFLKRYVHISTPEVYGSCSGFVKEDFPFNPSTPYAVSRSAADMSLKTFSATYNFPVVTTRAANVYGPGQQLYRIIPRTILFILLGRKLQLHGGGTSTRSFIHMRDVSDATWRIMEGGKNGDTYHISTSDVISIRDLVAQICTRLNVRFEDHVEVVGERLGKDSAYHLESSKVRAELGWKDQTSFDQGLNECIAWVRDNFDALKAEPYDYLHKP